MDATERAYVDNLRRLQTEEHNLRSEHWQKERLYKDMERCKGSPRACGVGIWRDWTTAEREGKMEQFYKSHKHIGDTRNRLSAINQRLEQIDVERQSLSQTENARKLQLLDREYAVEQGKKQKVVRAAQARGGHPEQQTSRPPPRRHKSGGRSRFQPKARHQPKSPRRSRR